MNEGTAENQVNATLVFANKKKSKDPLVQAPRLRQGEKIKIELFGRQFQIIAGEDEESTVIRELVFKTDQKKANGTVEKEKIIEIDQADASVESKSLESNAEDEVDLNEDEEQSLAIMSSQNDKESENQDTEDPDLKVEARKFKGSIKKEIKFSLSTMFLFDKQADQKEKLESSNLDKSNLLHPFSAPNVSIKKNKSMRSIIKRKIRVSTKNLFMEPSNEDASKEGQHKQEGEAEEEKNAD